MSPMQSGTPIYHVDAFTRRPFAGNPAAVCLLERPARAPWMQAIACEMNLSETAFLHPVSGGWRLRWFTPTTEVRLCGHATLASAHVLWETRRLAAGATAVFHTRSGRLSARRAGSAIEMDFPAKPVVPARAPRGLLGALEVEARFVGKSEFDYLIEVGSADVVRGLRPDFARLATLPVRGIIVTSVSDRRDCDFLSRFFAPAAGVDEDPVTGSAHCSLGPYWQGRLGRSDFRAWQASARGGELGVRVAGSRVLLSGMAVTVLSGQLA